MKYIHLAIHHHKYGEDIYLFSSNQSNHMDNDELRERIVKLFNIELDGKIEYITFQFNVEVKELDLA
jgi:hypothetical protein